MATDDGVLERLDELGAIDEGADDELGATLERILLATLLVAPPKLVANLEVALMPLVLLIR